MCPRCAGRTGRIHGRPPGASCNPLNQDGEAGELCRRGGGSRRRDDWRGRGEAFAMRGAGRSRRTSRASSQEPRAKSWFHRLNRMGLVCGPIARRAVRLPVGQWMRPRRGAGNVRSGRVASNVAGRDRGQGGARSGRPRADRPLRGERPCQPGRRKRRPSAGGRSMRPRRSAGDVQSGRTVPGVVRRAELHGRCPSKSVLCPRWALQGCRSTGLRGSSSSRADPRRRLRPFASPELGTAPSRRDRLRTSGRSCHCGCDRRGGGPGRG